MWNSLGIDSLSLVIRMFAPSWYGKGIIYMNGNLLLSGRKVEVRASSCICCFSSAFSSKIILILMWHIVRWHVWPPFTIPVSIRHPSEDATYVSVIQRSGLNWRKKLKMHQHKMIRKSRNWLKSPRESICTRGG